MPVRPEGPCPAKIMLVGEAPGEQEVQKGIPFVGASGVELNKMLHEATIMRSECFVTNVVRERPFQNKIENFIAFKKKDRTHAHTQLRDKWVLPVVAEGYDLLRREIALVKPNVIVAFGNVALWALTGQWGITKWRGSLLECNLPGAAGVKIVPAYHPAAILRQWSWRGILVHDLKRAAREMQSAEITRLGYTTIPAPSFDQAVSILQGFLTRLDAGERIKLAPDIETRAGHIACIGFAWSKTEAICLPLMCVERKEGYWSLDEEVVLMWLLYQVLTHPNVECVGQNFLYDAQYFYRHLHYLPRVKRDTMIAQHAMFSNMQKSLDFLSSLYCANHVFWKDDGKNWDQRTGEQELWAYNCIDCVRTYEVDEEQQKQVDAMGLRAVHDFQQAMFHPVLQAMCDGVLVDRKVRAQFALDLQKERAAREQYFIDVLGHSLNPSSAPMMQKLFYEDLKQRKILKRRANGTYTPSLDDDALVEISRREPLLKPLIMKIAEYRTLGVFFNTFISAPLDIDNRMRCSYNIGGTKNYRLSSSENAFGSGGNLQNLPSDESAAARDMDALSGLELPNIRRLFVPDPGQEFFDIDLSKADFRIVAWESDEPELKLMFREGRDPYVELAREYYKKPNITKTSGPEYNIFKSFVHATNYLGEPKGLAGRLGLNVQEVDRTQKFYFGKFPRIKLWQDEVKKQVTGRRFVQNIFGYRFHVIDRIDDKTYRDFISWIPSSSIGILINKGWHRIYTNPVCQKQGIRVLLQTHDSLSGTYPIQHSGAAGMLIKSLCEVPLPYAEPLIIPVGIKTSRESWGSCK